MATFTDPSAFAAHIGQYGTKIKGANFTATKAAAEAAATAIRRSGSRYRIKGRTGKRWALGAKVTPGAASGSNVRFYVNADPAGFWVLVEKGAGPHVIRPRRRGRGGRDTRKALAVPGRGYFAKVNHPGTGGAIGNPWGQGLAVAKKIGPQAYGQALLSSVFGKAA